MNNDAPPSDSLVLQALHAIRAEAQKTNERLDILTTRVDGTNQRLDLLSERLDGTNERLDGLRVFTVMAVTELNRKVDENTTAVGRLTNETHEHLDHFLSGQGAKLVQRVDVHEEEVRRIASKLDH